MSAAAVRAIAKEVAGLAAITPGPERAAACTRPRRRSWEVLALIQGSLSQLGGQQKGTDWLQECQAQEALDCCKDLEEALKQLQALDRESCASHWASTEYTVLAEEIQQQRQQAQRVLGSLPDEATATPECQMAAPAEEEPAAAPPAATATPAQEPVEAESPEGSSARSGSSAGCDSGTSASKRAERGKPVRFSVEDLQDEYPCGWGLHGTCPAGCTVGGCQAHMVEAW